VEEKESYIDKHGLYRARSSNSGRPPSRPKSRNSKSARTESESGTASKNAGTLRSTQTAREYASRTRSPRTKGNVFGISKDHDNNQDTRMQGKLDGSSNNSLNQSDSGRRRKIDCDELRIDTSGLADFAL
jgi:hypothetical protein